MRFLLLFVWVTVISAGEGKLTWKDLQSLGSRSSTHDKPVPAFPNQDWSKPTLDEQLDRGVQMFEFWIHQSETGPFVAFDPPLAVRTNCLVQERPSVLQCSDPIVDYVREHPYNPPVFIDLRWSGSVSNSIITDMEDQVTAMYSDVIYTLGDYLEDGKYSSVREAIRRKGFPTIEETRGKIVFITFSCSNSCPDKRVSKFFERTTPPSLAILEEGGHENTMFLCDTCRGMVEVTPELRAQYVTTAFVDAPGSRLEGYFDPSSITTPLFLTVDVIQPFGFISPTELGLLPVFAAFDPPESPGATADAVFNGCDIGFGNADGLLSREEIEACIPEIELREGFSIFDFLTPPPVVDYIADAGEAIKNDINFLYAWNVMPGQFEGQVTSIDIASPGCVRSIPSVECFKALAKCPNDKDDNDDKEEDPCKDAKNKKKCKKAGDNCVWDKEKEMCYLDECPEYDNKDDCKSNGCKWKNNKKGCMAK